MNRDFDRWNINKKIINEKQFRGFVKEREIWWCSLGVNIGDEEDGKNQLFERPVLVIKKFNQDIVLAVPLTTKTKDNKYYYSFTHNNINFAVILSQLRLISTKRLTRKIRKIDNILFKLIIDQIINVIFKSYN
jgi:mRNA interferase MazF